MGRGRRILGIIPKGFRRRGAMVSLTILIRALLNFVGLAALLPILYLILESEKIHSNPYLQRAFDWFGFTSDTKFVCAVSGSIVLFIVVKCLVNLFLYRFERDYIYALYRHLSRNMYIDYFARGLSFIKHSNSAVLARNVNVVCYTFVAGVLRPAATIASELILFLLLFVSIALYNIWAALLTLLVFIPTVIVYYGLVKKRLNRYGDTENEAQRRKYRDVIETYRGYADIELSNAFPRMLSSFDDAIDTIVRVGRKNATIGTLPTLFTEIGLAVGMTLIVALSVGMGSSEMKILFGIFAIAALRLLPSIRSIMSAWTSIRYNRYTVDTIFEAQESAVSEKEDFSDSRMPFSSGIVLDRVSFRFSDADRDTISDLSLSIAKGEKVGINGRSGVGKTTLFNLLLGFYSPTSGTISIDSQVLSPKNRRQWQNSIGYVSQSVFLTDRTIKENIALGISPKDIDRDKVVEAVRMANLEEFTSSLPNGIDTRIGECGALLSGGQRQRIGIARALYKQADVLFFDEATSSLDSSTEQSINESIASLKRMKKDLTIIIVAHRESSLEYCDRVITLK